MAQLLRILNKKESSLSLTAMKKIQQSLIVICTLFFYQGAYAGLIKIIGVYNGKNLFIENSFIDKAKHHCITNVYVNDKHLLKHPKGSVVELNLSSFTYGTKLEIRIYHKDVCKPLIMNPNVIEKPLINHFAYTLFKISEERIHWETHGEDEICKYTVQQKVNGIWKDIKYVKGSGTRSANSYSLPSKHTSGTNTYRIKYRATGGKTILSKEVNYNAQVAPVYFYPKRVDDYITFETDDNREIEYLVTDLKGNEIYSGKGLVVDCRKLPHGEYYVLKYDSKEGRFYKKDFTPPEEE